MKIHTALERWPMKKPFHISGVTFHERVVLVVRLERNGYIGTGEAAGVYYLDGGADDLRKQILNIESSLDDRLDNGQLTALMPPGGARNALDSALWDLRAKETGVPVWKLLGLEEPIPLITTFTCSVEAPDDMAAEARSYGEARAIKIKLGGDGRDQERIRAVREARPDVWLGVDANQGLTPVDLHKLMPTFMETDVRLIEQPFARGREHELLSFASDIPLAADESFQDIRDLEQVSKYFGVVNIKLDKCGGLTEGLRILARARELGLTPMVGNMIGTSLAMAPAFILGQLCGICDLDGPISLQSDRAPSVSYEDGFISCSPDIWGG